MTATNEPATEPDTSSIEDAPEFYRVRGSVLRAVLNYLAAHPYAQVAALIEGIQASAPIADPPKKPASTIKKVPSSRRPRR